MYVYLCIYCENVLHTTQNNYKMSNVYVQFRLKIKYAFKSVYLLVLAIIHTLHSNLDFLAQ